MNSIADQTEELLGRLICSFIEYPESLRITRTELPNRVNWEVTGQIDDVAKIVGKKGAHVQALQFLIAQMGMKNGQQFRLRVRDPQPAPRSPDRPSPQIAAYNPSEARALLGDVLGAILDSPPMLEVFKTTDQRLMKDGNTIEFTFTIRAVNQQDHETLAEPFDPSISPLTTLAALGTLFRAYGGKEGVSFKVEVPHVSAGST